MLPTKEEAKNRLWTHPDGKLHYNPYPYGRIDKAYHLYILSDEPIKEGDYAVIKDSKTGLKETVIKVTATALRYLNEEDKKIIATTDTSLMIGFTNPNVNSISLPQPSQSFIEKYIERYNAGDPITHVMVEYDERLPDNLPVNTGGKTVSFSMQLVLKVNPKDNTITIRSVKDTWSREEHIAGILKFQTDLDNYRKSCHYGPNKNEEQKWTEKWFEENL